MDVGNMGGGESAVKIASEQVRNGLDGMNYNERAYLLVHEGFVETASLDWEVNKDFGCGDA